MRNTERLYGTKAASFLCRVNWLSKGKSRDPSHGSAGMPGICKISPLQKYLGKHLQASICMWLNAYEPAAQAGEHLLITEAGDV